MNIIYSLGPVDYVFMAVLALSMLLGALKGFVQVAMSLAGWFVALAASYYLAEVLARYLTSTGLGETGRYALAFVVTFIIALILWGIAATLMKQAVNKIGLGGLDRLLGAALGLLRGAVIAVSLAALVSATPADKFDLWQNSIAVKMAKAAAQASKPFLPGKIAALLN